MSWDILLSYLIVCSRLEHALRDQSRQPSVTEDPHFGNDSSHHCGGGQLTYTWLTPVCPLVSITDCFATSGWMLRITFHFWMNIYVGGVVVEESIKCATHSRLKSSLTPYEEHWWVEAYFASLSKHLTAAKHTHRPRHGTTKQTLTVTLPHRGRMA